MYRACFLSVVEEQQGALAGAIECRYNVNVEGLLPLENLLPFCFPLGLEAACTRQSPQAQARISGVRAACASRLQMENHDGGMFLQIRADFGVHAPGALAGGSSDDLCAWPNRGGDGGGWF